MDADTREMFGLILGKLDAMDKRLDAMETRQTEIFEVVKSIEHSNQVHKAEIDSLNIRTVHIEGTINAVGDAFNKRKAV